MAASTETRALSAALSAPAFITRGGGGAMSAANRHVGRWAPETAEGAGFKGLTRTLRNVGFVDRLVSPWMETAQRSASMRLFAQYASTGMSEREGGAVSWVFPRPWYQDELDWLAASRQQKTQERAVGSESPAMFTTRGTYVTPARAATVMPSALYEFVAPSLSIAQPIASSSVMGAGAGIDFRTRGDAYSPLVSLAAVQAAHLMERAVAPVMRPRGADAAAMGTQNAGLRTVLASMLARAQIGSESPSRISGVAPELVTPPAPRPATLEAGASTSTFAATAQAESSFAPSAATAQQQQQVLQLAQQFAEQRARVAEVTRIAQQAAQREIAVREAARLEHVAREQQTIASSSGSSSSAASAAAATEQREQIVAAARAAEANVRARAQGTNAERAAQVQRAEADRQVAQQQDERARIEQRIAARMVERTQHQAAQHSSQRLHEESRTAAVQHAREAARQQIEASAAASASATRTEAAVAAAAAPASYAVPAEVVAAIASLPPQLGQFLAAQASRSPGGAVAAIAELNNALRTVELMAHGAATGAAFEPTRGPRMMMPAGMGGLVAGVDRAAMIADRPAALTGTSTRAQFAPMMSAAPMLTTVLPSAAPASARRMPGVAMNFVAPRAAQADHGGYGAPAPAPTSALAATAASPPAALSHVAWADRWLARFAGASQQSLDVLAAGSAADPAARFQALLASAPEAVFVAPTFDSTREAPRVRVDDEGRVHVSSAPATLAATMAQAAWSTGSGAPASMTGAPAYASAPAPAPFDGRVDDSAATPDDVFAAIAVAAASKRQVARAVPMDAPSFAPSLISLDADRIGAADLLAHAVPGSPGSGLSAGLASSPFASALRHLMPMPVASSFDVRSLYGSGIASTYLSGLLEPAAHEIGTTAPLSRIGGSMGMGGSIGIDFGALAQAAMGADGTVDMAVLAREVPGFDMTYVAPSLPAAGEGDVASAFAGPSSSSTSSASMADTARMVEAAVAAGLPSDVARAVAQAVAAQASAPAAASSAAQLTTLRSALLAWHSDQGPSAVSASTISNLAAPELVALAQGLGPTHSGATAQLASSMLGSLVRPLAGDGAMADDHNMQMQWNAPGMMAERAHHFSIAQERSSSDLAFDFVTPELVLAARVYGLGPAEAAQAARLALAGPGQLAAMAGAVDRTFIQAMALDQERRSHGSSAMAASSPGASTAERRAAALAGVDMPVVRRDLPTLDAGELESLRTLGIFGSLGGTGAGANALGGMPAASSFGVERRSPRGAFLWPAATVSALNLNAPGPDGQQGMNVAALELLAAQAVAELGTFTALGLDHIRENTGSLGGEATFASGSSSSGSSSSGSSSAVSSSDTAFTSQTAARRAPGMSALGLADEPGEPDVLAAATAMMPAARRARFEKLYVALGQSAAGKDWSPAARAARALALAGHSDDGAQASARERAAMAWDVLPIVYADDESVDEAHGFLGAAAATSRGGAARMAPQMTALRGPSGVVRGDGPGNIDIRPGLANLSARAGEALGAYVQPMAASIGPSSSSSSSAQNLGALRRVPTAAQEMVQTGGGRSGGRFGGGEVEIPAWFESAAKRMFAERSSSSSVSSDISLAELTFIQTAPAQSIAAAEVAPSSAAPVAPHTEDQVDSHHNFHEPVDVESVAHDVYRHIMTMMDSARARNGEPFV